jgi:hypothetical protein
MTGGKGLKQIKLTPGQGGIGNDAVFIDRMKVRDKIFRFFFCSEKAAMFKSGAKRQAAPNQKTFGVLFFYTRGNRRWFMLDKNKMR